MTLIRDKGRVYSGHGHVHWPVQFLV